MQMHRSDGINCALQKYVLVLCLLAQGAGVAGAIAFADFKFWAKVFYCRCRFSTL